MNTSVFKNREFSRTFLAMLAASLILMAVFALFTRAVWSQVNRVLVERNVALLGHILEASPQLRGTAVEGEIVQAFTGEISEEDIQSGLAAAQKYGYTLNIPINVIPLLQHQHLIALAGSFFLLAIQMLVFLRLLYGLFSYIYRRLGAMSLAAERITRGDFSSRFPDTGEGELQLLGFQFNQLSNRLQLTFEALEQDRQLTKDMVSGISHQLKTPLASARMFTELLLDGAAEEPALREEFLQKNLSQLEHMEWLIHALLKIARLEAGVIEFNKENENLVLTVREGLEAVNGLILQKKQQVSLSLPQAPVVLLHDRKWLGEGFETIIKNAALYTPEGGTISLSLEESDATVAVTVSDSGPGIPEEELPRIFERFYRGAKQRTSSKGSGIGLALAKLVVEKHQGIIQVSNREGQGATFSVTFPKVTANE